MIINALVKRYENQAAEGKIARRGWSKAKVSFGLRVSESGEIADILDLRTEVLRGKKNILVQKEIEVPEQAEKTSKIVSSFLCDKADYILGIGGKTKHFETAKEFHKKILSNCNSAAARAVKNFFEKWIPSEIENFPKLQEILKELQEGEKIIFMFGENFAIEDAEIKMAWENYKQISIDAPLMQCLVTGEISLIARIHPKINGVKKAKSNAAIVSFNADAFESYGRVDEQNLNAPISEYAAFAYTTALNDLLSDSEHKKFLGDMTVVYWAEENSAACQDFLTEFLYPNEKEISNQTLNSLMKCVQDKTIIFNGTKLNYENPFYILGLSPNSGRISVRFFLEKNFGEVLKNIAKHYEDLKIIKPTFKTLEYIPLWQILNATVPSKAKDKTASSLMSGAVVNAIMTGTNYPISLFQNTMLRIKAEQDVTYERAAILKAYFTRNKGRENLMALDENSDDRNYVLGRIFSVFEAIQCKANPGINSTIKDTYFNSACANPDRIFPILQKLSVHHLKKLEKGYKIYFDKQLTNLMSKLELTEKKSSLLTLEEQGIFILGYYHQTQERYKSKEAKENG